MPSVAAARHARHRAPGAALTAVGHAGRWITDARGRVLVLHGTNMVYKLAPYDPAATGFGADDAGFLHRIGWGAVRVGIIWKALEPAPGVYDDGYLARIADTVRVLAAHGVRSMLDFHQDMYNERFQGEGEPDWAVQDDGLPAIPKEGFPLNYEVMPALQHAFDHFWDNSPGPGGVGLQDRYAAAWRHVAAYFAGLPGVLGYELFNEPFPGTPYLNCAAPGGCPTFDAKLTAFDARVAAAIRAVDRHTIIFHEPNVLFNFGFATNVGALDDPQAGFAFHDYCLMGEASGCASQGTTFANAAAHVAATHEAEILTEFGAINSASDLEHMLALADQNMVPWLEWAYCGCQDPTTSGPGTVQAIVIDPSKPPQGNNLELGTVRALVEPYPQLVSGTPLGWGFDRPSRTFTLRYSTARASGHGRFRAGSLTAIATPALVYGGRYGAQVRGARIASRRGAGTLLLAACPRVRQVTVTVTPNGRRRGGCRAHRPRRRHHRRRG